MSCSPDSAIPMPSMVADSLTLVITTSPTPSAPSTELLSSVFDSFRKYCPILLACHVIVVFDTYEQITAQARLKRGQVTPDLANHYGEYQDNVKNLIKEIFSGDGMDLDESYGEGEAEYGSTGSRMYSVPFKTSRSYDRRITFVEPSQRLGFGLAVRTAVRLATTAYVWIQQHDWSLNAEIPVRAILEVMQASESDPDVPVKYVCLPSTRMLSYAVSADVNKYATLRKLTATLKRTFPVAADAEQGVPLTPLFFWYDKPHIALASHYLICVFPSRLSIQRGVFIEDTLGHAAKTQMKEGNWLKWASWVYYPEDGKKLCLKHLEGRTFRGKEKEAEMKALYIAQSRKVAQQRTSSSNVQDDEEQNEIFHYHATQFQ